MKTAGTQGIRRGVVTLDLPEIGDNGKAPESAEPRSACDGPRLLGSSPSDITGGPSRMTDSLTRTHDVSQQPRRPNLRERWEREVWTSTAITDGCRVLLLALARHMDHRGYVSVPRPQLAADIGRNERRVGERIEQAVELKFLARVKRGQKGVTSVYRAMLPAPVSEQGDSPLNSQQAANPLADVDAADQPAEPGFSRHPGGPASIGVRTRGDGVCSQEPNQNRDEGGGVEDEGDEAAARSACRVASFLWSGRVDSELGEPEPRTESERSALADWTRRQVALTETQPQSIGSVFEALLPSRASA